MTRESYDVAFTIDEGEALRDFISQTTMERIPEHIDALALYTALYALKQVFGAKPEGLEQP